MNNPNSRYSSRILATLFLLTFGQAALAEFLHTLPLMPPASNALQQGFVRIINHSPWFGEVHIHAIDDTGRRFGPITLYLDAMQTAHFNSHDLEYGNVGKELSAGVGDGHGDWRLELRTDLDIQPLAYIRTVDGFVTTMHEVIAERGVPDPHYQYEARVPIFNPGSNANQVSRLRIINPGDTTAEVEVHGMDDEGSDPPRGYILVTLPPGAARMLTASDLERGGDFAGHFGDGSGKWQIVLRSTTPGIQAMSLLQSPTGNLTNLSIGRATGATTLPLVMSADHPRLQSFVRIINRSPFRGGTVHIHAIDDAGQRFGPVSLTLDPLQTRHLNSQDLENGNPDKGLSAGVGPGVGNWRLELDTTLAIEPLAYIRSSDGFLTSMHEVAPGESTSMRKIVPLFNPGSNRNQQSFLRIINQYHKPARVVIRAQDDRGDFAPMGDVTLTVPAGGAQTWTAQELEDGASGLSGRFGDGQGKWRLFVSPISYAAPLQVMSLLRSPTGNLTNLSGLPPVPIVGNSAPVAHDIALSHDLAVPYLNVQLIGTDRNGDTLLYALDGPTSGPGYRDAFVEPESGQLYAQLTSTPSNRIQVPYKVSDGLLFSNTAHVLITVETTEDTSLGAQPVSTQEYAAISTDRSDYRNLPRKVDLSNDFPTPGDQETQGSCVAFATAYALKSYQERREERWEFTNATIFSPAWIYNQVRSREPCTSNGQPTDDCGATVPSAFELMIEKGTATLATMPYDTDDYYTQPDDDARRDAARYKARDYRRVNSMLEIKSNISRRHPVVIGMRVSPEFGRTTPTVYNSFPGITAGHHAVTLVGYDDDKYGGAFHAINSWGADKHEGGFFWITYSMFNRIGGDHVIQEAYRLYDERNENVPDYVPNPEPCLRGIALPNLQPAAWGVYKPPQSALAVWAWSVINTGLGDAPANVQVDLMLSQDADVNSSDILLTSEVIAEPIGAGERVDAEVFREAAVFEIPSSIPPGQYYLGMWVDSSSQVRECVETDNVALNAEPSWNQPADLPDLSLVHWKATLNGDEADTGTLEFMIGNVGRADVVLHEDLAPVLLATLVLHSDINPFTQDADGNFLFYPLTLTPIPFLTVGEAFSVGGTSGRPPVTFSLQTTGTHPLVEGVESISSGNYYMSMLVDAGNLLLENNEHNNVSEAPEQVCTPAALCDLGLLGTAERKHSMEGVVSSSGNGKPDVSWPSYFNGKVFPAQLMKRVQIMEREDGTREMRLVDTEEAPFELKFKKAGVTIPDDQGVPLFFEKVIESQNAVIFPAGNVIQLQ